MKKKKKKGSLYTQNEPASEEESVVRMHKWRNVQASRDDDPCVRASGCNLPTSADERLYEYGFPACFQCKLHQQFETDLLEGVGNGTTKKKKPLSLNPHLMQYNPPEEREKDLEIFCGLVSLRRPFLTSCRPLYNGYVSCQS